MQSYKSQLLTWIDKQGIRKGLLSFCLVRQRMQANRAASAGAVGLQADARLVGAPSPHIRPCLGHRLLGVSNNYQVTGQPTEPFSRKLRLLRLRGSALLLVRYQIDPILSSPLARSRQSRGIRQCASMKSQIPLSVFLLFFCARSSMQARSLSQVVKNILVRQVTPFQTCVPECTESSRRRINRLHQTKNSNEGRQIRRQKEDSLWHKTSLLNSFKQTHSFRFLMGQLHGLYIDRLQVSIE